MASDRTLARRRQRDTKARELYARIRELETQRDQLLSRLQDLEQQGAARAAAPGSPA